MSQPPPLELPTPLQSRFDAWIDATKERHSPPLTAQEIRRGIQALSALYVEHRRKGRIAERAVDGAGKRAALACYYAPLHYLGVHHTLSLLEGSFPTRIERILDLGCGTGAAGAAAALAMDCREVLGVDRSGWALREARATYRAFDLRGRTQRVQLPGGLPRERSGTLAVLGWAANEFADDERERLLSWAEDRVRSGRALVIVEPLATSATPWWNEWCDGLEAHGVANGIIKQPIERPHWIRDMDKAAGLDHRVLGLRWLAGPLEPPVVGSAPCESGS